MKNSFALKGNICYSSNTSEIVACGRAYLVCYNGVSQGVFSELPLEYDWLPVVDYGDNMIIPGLTDLHVHAPQFAFRGLGLNFELLEWLEKRAFPEEVRYGDLKYAEKAYAAFVSDLKKGPNTRAAVFATRHVAATKQLMDMLEESGLVTMVGKVNMDRNSHEELQEAGAGQSAKNTAVWMAAARGKYKNTSPIITPRFIPACSDELLTRLGKMARELSAPVQSHLSENKAEVLWVKELCPWAANYGAAYDHFGLFGGGVPTIMAHCVYCTDAEIELMRERGVFVAHAPQSNTNLSSGIAPVRKYLKAGLPVGLASDVAGGNDTSILRIMRSAIEVSKLRWRLVSSDEKPLTTAEVFHMGTAGGGAFFGKVGSFEQGFEFDAVVIDDTNLAAPYELSLTDRLDRIIYFADDRNIKAKYVRGKNILA